MLTVKQLICPVCVGQIDRKALSLTAIPSEVKLLEVKLSRGEFELYIPPQMMHILTGLQALRY